MRSQTMQNRTVGQVGQVRSGVGSTVLVASVIAVLGGLQQQAAAITYTSTANNTTSAVWSDVSKWNANGIPVSNQDAVIVFNTTLNTTATNDLGTIQLNRLASTNTGTKSQTIAGSSTNRLDFVASSTSVLPTMQFTNNGNATTVSIPFTVTDALTLTNSAGGVTISSAIVNNGGITLDGSGTGSVGFQTGVISGGGGVTVSGAYAVTMSAAETYTGATTISSGSFLQIGNNGTTGKISLSSTIINDGTLSFRRTNAIAQGTDFGTISGDGSVRQLGTSTLTLNANNSYQGRTTVSAGTLNVTGSIAKNSSADVLIQSDTQDETTAFTATAPKLTRKIAAATAFGTTDATQFGSKIVGDSFGGGFVTQADIVAGNHGGVDRNVTMQWRPRTTAEQAQLFSDVISLSGLGNGGQTRPNGDVEADPFVLQMSYDETQISALTGLNEAAAAAAGLIRLGYLDLGAESWVSAVDGNFAGTPLYFNRAYIAGTDGLAVGRYGVDTAANVVWAVIDHSSQFSVVAVPEPGSLSLLAAGAFGLLAYRRRVRD